MVVYQLILEISVDIELSLEHDNKRTDLLVFGVLGLWIRVDNAIDLFESLELFDHIVIFVTICGLVSTIT